MRVSGIGMALCLASALARAQSTTENVPAPTNFGVVVGHVYLSEGNLPARLADVALQPVNASERDLISGKVRTGLSDRAGWFVPDRSCGAGKLLRGGQPSRVPCAHRVVHDCTIVQSNS